MREKNIVTGNVSRIGASRKALTRLGAFIPPPLERRGFPERDVYERSACMWVRVLGSAAGGGFPQWNCNCPNCRSARDGSLACQRRTQSSIAISADYERWFLFNASPDIRVQMASFSALWPRDGVRHTPIQAVVLTDAERDHTLGLL